MTGEKKIVNDRLGGKKKKNPVIKTNTFSFDVYFMVLNIMRKVKTVESA